MSSFTIIGKKFNQSEFKSYCQGIAKQDWVKKIVLHNTSEPSLATRPGGILTAQHIQNLKDYYESEGWSGGPHLFVDATGIWVFNPLNDPGVHSPSFNSSTWGVEMLGEYEVESFTTGLGAQVADNAAAACAALATIQGWKTLNDARLAFHKEDPKTSHKHCPGKFVNKSQFIVNANKKNSPPFSVIVEGTLLKGAFIGEDGLSYAPIRSLSEKLGFKVSYDAIKNQAIITK